MKKAPESIDAGNGITLRINDEDLADLTYAVVDRNRAHLRTWFDWADQTTSPETLRAFYRRQREQAERGENYYYRIFDGPALVGAIDLHDVEWRAFSARIGYWLAQDAQGRGIMTRSVTALTNLALRDLGLNRVEIRVAPGNERSRAIPRRLGFRYEALIEEAQILHGRFIDLEVYVMIARRWASSSLHS
jgi:ribosomal-protein-serine acetyltransferase